MTRRKAREASLKMIFQLDLGSNTWEALAETLKESNLSSENDQFANSIVRGAWEHKDEIDRIIEIYAKEWKLDRFASVDKNILRLAVYELLYCPEISPNIVINEAIHLAKIYSYSDAGSFINGILDKIWNQHIKPGQDTVKEQDS